MLCLGTRVTTHRVVVLDVSSLTDRTIPVNDNPYKNRVALSPRYKAYRQRRASNLSVISIVCMWHPGRGTRYISAATASLISEPLSNNSNPVP